MAQTKVGPWKERGFIDLWSLVHLFLGFALGGFLLYLGVAPYIASAVAIALFVGWEIFELKVSLRERAANRITDILVDYAGFFLTQVYVYAWGGTMYWYIPASAAFVAFALEAWGIIDYFNRKKSR